MKPIPCPRCGSEATNGTFCLTCLRELHPLVKGIGEGSITLCVLCDRIFQEGSWRNTPLDEAVGRAINPGIQFDPAATIEGVEFSLPEFERKPGIAKKVEVLTVVTGRTEDARESYEEEYDVPLAYKVTLCTHCRKARTEYFEGILQVRHETPAVRQAIAEYLARERRKGLLNTKTTETKDGHDYFLSDHRAVGHLARTLHKEFGGELKVNAQHFSENKQAGKILYRTNALVVIPEYQKGDIILRDGVYLVVRGVSQKVKANELLSGKQVVFPYLRGDATLLVPVKAAVASVEPFQVIHPETYQAVAPENLEDVPDIYEPDDQVKVVVHGGHLFFKA